MGLGRQRCHPDPCHHRILVPFLFSEPVDPGASGLEAWL